MNPIFKLKIGPKVQDRLPTHEYFVNGNHQDLTGKWCHISTTSLLRTMEVDLIVNSSGPNVFISTNRIAWLQNFLVCDSSVNQPLSLKDPTNDEITMPQAQPHVSCRPFQTSKLASLIVFMTAGNFYLSGWWSGLNLGEKQRNKDLKHPSIRSWGEVDLGDGVDALRHLLPNTSQRRSRSNFTILSWNSGWVGPELEWAGAECGQLLEVRSHRMPTTAAEEQEERRELEGFV